MSIDFLASAYRSGVGGTNLYKALKEEGFPLPEECGDVKLVMPVDGVFQLHYVVSLTEPQLAAIGRALVRVATREEVK